MSSLALPAMHLPTPPANPPASTAPTLLSSQPTRTRKRSTPPLDEESDEEEEDDKRRGPSKKNKASGVWGWEDMGDHKYMVEIRQMMFVFGEVQTPLPETVKLVEDIVRGQIIEIVIRARLLTHLRSSRFLSPEDLIFLIRDDRGKVNRLRTYLSWKDVRKRAKEEAERAGEDIELEVDEDKAMKGRKQMVKLPWEVLTPFQTFLRSMPGKEEEDDEDEDELQAHEDSMQRLKEADEITKKMTKNEYAQYSECRQASFTYRRARRFRDFINFSAYLDVRPNDDIVDILGFLAFEMVRSLCVTALDLRERLEKTKLVVPPVAGQPQKPASPVKESTTKSSNTPSLFAPPPSARQPLQPCHILEAFAQIQRTQAANRVGGMGNFRGGVGKKKMALV
nr:transcription initiation protein SPT3 [Cryptococcus depauperatus CBS 7841]